MPPLRKNIRDEIQIGLKERIRARTVYGADGKSQLMLDTKTGKRMTDPQSAETDYVLSREAEVSKSPFVRMIAPGQTKTDVIYGRFIEDIGGIETGQDAQSDALQSLQSMVPTSEGLIDTTSRDVRFGRSKAGIRGLTVNYIKYGGAVRQAEISWTCWTLEQLSNYQKGSFLSIGRYIIVDWGWVRSDSAISLSNIPKIIQTQNGKFTLNQELLEKEGEGNEAGRQSIWETFSKRSHGDWAGLVGVITDFTWTQREDGGFDCTTKVLSKGSNILDKELEKPDDGLSSGAPIDVYDFDSVMEDLNKGMSLNIENITTKIMSGAAQSITQRIQHLDLEILAKYFFDDDGEYDLDKKQTEVVKSDDDCIFAIIQADKPSKEISLFTTDKEDKVTRADNFNSWIWVTLGWFEDNILSYYLNVVDKVSGTREMEFRSLNKIKTAGVAGKGKSIKISNSKHLRTYDPSFFIIPGNYASSEIPLTSIYHALARRIEGSRLRFAADDLNGDEGDIRNILINLEQIKGAFSTPGVTISTAMNSIAGVLNQKVKIWDLSVKRLTQSDELPVRYGIAQDSREQAEVDIKESFIFDNYGANSLIHEGSLQLSAKVPDKFAAIAGFSSTRFASGDNKDVIKNFMIGDSRNKSEQNASRIADFFRDDKNIGKIESAIEERLGKSDNKSFGNSDPITVGRGSFQKDLKQDGLKNSKWNHEILKEIEKVSGFKQEQIKKLEQKHKEASEFFFSPGQFGDTRNVESDIAALRLVGFTTARRLREAGGSDWVDPSMLFPYNTEGVMRPHFLRTLKYKFEDNFFTRTLDGLDTDIAMPLEVSMTIDGIGGIYVGDIFRLSYLPEVYGQTNLGDTVEPKTYFTILELSHVLDENGWKTEIKAGLLANGERTRQETDRIIRETYGDDVTLESLKKEVEKQMDEAFYKLINDPKRPTFIGPPVAPPPATNDDSEPLEFDYIGF